ncbi:MAG: hypothetical protein CVT48_02685 [Thermoplasmata archaeon HGW-Thermoplasmata-1]|nr:MAG: hypothetical protein CVT48_02685 [Thermoplasmata archaeon HGW-Thermoplasmata-1]
MLDAGKWVVETVMPAGDYCVFAAIVKIGQSLGGDEDKFPDGTEEETLIKRHIQNAFIYIK